MSLILLVVALVVGLLTVAPRPGLDGKIATIVKPYSFSISAWEFRTITLQEIPGLFRPENTGDVAPVIEYFTNARLVRSLEGRLSESEAGAPVDAAPVQAQLDDLRKRQKAVADRVEATIEEQIADTLRAEGIYNPSGLLRLSFPQVNFEMARPPSMLIVSPRDRIESIGGAALQPDLPVDRAEQIESRVDKLDLSSLVTTIGGVTTYPAFVADDMDLRSTIETATHEWVHQYLAFRPLGFRYILDVIGIAQSRDITSMNETVADIIGNEIGGMVYQEYYAPMLSERSPQPPQDGDDPPPLDFDFNAEMRAIRQQVDSLLSQGKIDEAERYMNERRDYLAGHGYYIRKLNQAYFAFHGSYADSPTSVDPIGVEMKQLRTDSSSIKQFLDRASSLSSGAALERAVAK